jgi:sugar phosphate isomerase/epimerase
MIILLINKRSVVLGEPIRVKFEYLSKELRLISLKIGLLALHFKMVPLEEMIFKAAELGFDGIDLDAARPHLSPLDYDTNSAKKVKELAESRGLSISNLLAVTDFCNPSPSTREHELLALKAVMELAVAMDVELVSTAIISAFTWGSFPQVPGRPYSLLAQYAHGVECVKEAVKIAEDLGVTLFLDNHLFLLVRDNLQIVKKIGSPNLKISIDAGNCIRNGEDLLEAAKACGSLLVHGHVKDPIVIGKGSRADEIKTHTVIGEGCINWEAYLKTLKDIGYKGFMAVETLTPKFFLGLADWETVEKGLKYLRKISEKVGI